MRNIIISATAILAISVAALPDEKWQSYTKEGIPKIEDNIIKAPVKLANKAKTAFCSCIIQMIPAVKPGKYEFSGYYRGDMGALWLVARSVNAERKESQLLGKWISKKDFAPASDKPGWNKFFYTVTIPAGAVRASVILQGYGKTDDIHEFQKVNFEESEE